MGISFPFVPRAAKNLVPGYRRRWQFSYAALLAKMSQAVPTMTFGETDVALQLKPSTLEYDLNEYRRKTFRNLFRSF